MRPIFYSTACLSAKEPLEQKIRTLIASGAPGVELGQNVTVPEGFDWSSLRGTPCAVHNYFPPPATDFLLNLAEEKTTSMNFCRHALEVCEKIGAQMYSVHGGFRADIPISELGSPIESRAVADYEDAYARLLASLRALGKEAGKMSLLVEPNVVAGFNAGIRDQLLMVTGAELMRLVNDVDLDNFGVLLDLGHLKVTAQTLGFDPLDFIEEISILISAFHLHSNDGKSDQHRPAMPDDWTFEITRDKRFRHLPIVIESHFDSPEALASYQTNFAPFLYEPL